MTFRERLLGPLRHLHPALEEPGELVVGSEVPNLLQPGGVSPLVVSQHVDVAVPVDRLASVKTRLRGIRGLVPTLGFAAIRPSATAIRLLCTLLVLASASASPCAQGAPDAASEIDRLVAQLEPYGDRSVAWSATARLQKLGTPAAAALVEALRRDAYRSDHGNDSPIMEALVKIGLPAARALDIVLTRAVLRSASPEDRNLEEPAIPCRSASGFPLAIAFSPGSRRDAPAGTASLLLLVPVDERLREYPQTGSLTADGQFSFRSVVPGEYCVLAIDPTAPDVREVRALLQSRGRRVTVGAGQGLTLAPLQALPGTQ